MKANIVFKGIFFVLLINSTITFASEQKIIYVVDNFKHGRLTQDCKQQCAKYSSDINMFLNDGWLIVSTSPKTVVAQEYVPHALFAGYSWECECIGTQYVIQKSGGQSTTENNEIKQLKKNTASSTSLSDATNLFCTLRGGLKTDDKEYKIDYEAKTVTFQAYKGGKWVMLTKPAIITTDNIRFNVSANEDIGLFSVDVDRHTGVFELGNKRAFGDCSAR